MNVKDRLVITDEELERADLRMLLNWLPNHINNEHVNIHKWKNGRGWTIECISAAVAGAIGHIKKYLCKIFDLTEDIFKVIYLSE